MQHVYDSKVLEDAVDLILDNEDDIKQALFDEAEWDRNDMEFLDTCFHEQIVDRAYTSEDAAFVIQYCKNEESDSGIWDGLDAIAALQAQAAYSYGNDVWFRAEELYKGIVENYEIEDDEEEESEEDRAVWALDVFRKQYSTLVVPTDDPEQQLEYINDYLLAVKRSGSMRTGSPVGSSYIDARCGVGFGMPEELEFLEADHKLAQAVPQLRGKYQYTVIALKKKLECEVQSPSDAVWEVVEEILEQVPERELADIDFVVISDKTLRVVVDSPGYYKIDERVVDITVKDGDRDIKVTFLYDPKKAPFAKGKSTFSESWSVNANGQDIGAVIRYSTDRPPAV
jgi:hypothetical protein